MTQQIDWEYWQTIPEVMVWQALCLSLRIDPKKVDLQELNGHLEFERRRSRLLSALSDRELFSSHPFDVADPVKSSVSLFEFAAWCISASPPLGDVPGDLFRIGQPLALERQERVRKAAGRYTLEEAAERLETAGERSATILARLKEAAGKERNTAAALPMHEPGREVRNVYGSGEGRQRQVLTFYEHAYWDDLNRWLHDNEPRITYRFPNPAPTKYEGRGSIESLPDPQRRLAALRALGGQVKRHNGGWKISGIKTLTAKEKQGGRARSDEKTIRADLKEAADAEREGAPLSPLAWPR